MAVCVDTLEATLNNFDCKLDSILYQLESKCSQVDIDSDENDSQPVLSCIQIISNFKEIQTDLNQIKREYKELEELKEEINEKIMNKCQQINTKVKQLEQKIPIN